MWGALGAWLVGIVSKEVLAWLKDLILGLVNDYKQKQADHEKAANQAARDAEKAKALKPDSTIKEIDDANDDQLSHFP